MVPDNSIRINAKMETYIFIKVLNGRKNFIDRLELRKYKMLWQQENCRQGSLMQYKKFLVNYFNLLPLVFV